MRYRLIISVIVTVTVGCAGFAPATVATRAQSDDFPRTVIDDTGTPVTISARPVIVAVIGVDPALSLIVAPGSLREISPTAAPVSGRWDGVGLLVLPELHAAAYPALVDAADAAGVPVYRTRPINGLEAWRARIAALGQATGREDRATAVLNRLEHRLQAVQARVGHREPVRALVLTPERYTFGRHTLITDLIAAAGGMNLAAGAGYDDYRQIEGMMTTARSMMRRSAPWHQTSCS